jgi:hypothetical protein
MDIPDNLKEQIDIVIMYVGDSTNDWLRIKKELINSFPGQDRKLFSRRHPLTKKQTPNAFDESVMLYWKSKTGISPEITKDKLHDPNWIHDKKPGWGLIAINQERKMRKHVRRSQEK